MNHLLRHQMRGSVLGVKTSWRYAARGYRAPLNDMQFLIEEVYHFPERYADLGYDKNLVNKEAITSILSETAKFAQNELSLLDETGDRVGLKAPTNLSVSCS
jgi:hypothetical protein